MRLHTTNFTQINNGDLEDSMNFQKVDNGDESAVGEVIGFGAISVYKSCKIHFRKLDDDLNCSKCNREIDINDVIEDFRSEIYIETSNKNIDENDIDVKEIVIFKKSLDAQFDSNTEEYIEEELNKMTGWKVKVDYNIDDANRYIAVTIKKIE